MRTTKGGDVIDDFRRKHHFLSNFYDARPFEWNAVTATSAEHHFNAAKTTDPAQRAYVYAAQSPGEAKRRGRQVDLRDGWDERVRFQAMRSVLQAKFGLPGLREQLLATGDALLIEGCRHHDQVWADCSCGRAECRLPGQNRLGLTLMDVRRQVSGAGAGRWPRVALTGHRSLPAAQQAWVLDALPGVLSILRQQHGTVVAISGLAQGADSWWAEAALEAGVALWAYVPFEEQAAKWPVRDQARWSALRASAAREQVLGFGYDVNLLHERNRLMVRDADAVVAVHDPAKTTGGTASTIRAARAAGRPLVRLNVADRTIAEIPAAVPVAA